MARKKQSKLGRPPKHEGELLSKNRTFRVRGTLDEQLEAAAQKAGRSVSEEIERRLEKSFQEDGAYGGPHLSAVFRLLADYKALIEAKAGVRWTESDRVRDEIAEVFTNLLAKELPGFNSVTIETVGQDGELRGVTGYASTEARNQAHPPPPPYRETTEKLRAVRPEPTRREGPK
jgi:hypothetical protein